MIDGERLSAQSGESSARVRKSIHTDAEPRNAVASDHANQAEKQDNREGRRDWLTWHRGQYAEVKHNHNSDKDPKEQEKLALRGEIGLACLVDDLGDIAHRFVNRQVLEPNVYRQSKAQTEQAKQNPDQQKFVAVDAHKTDLAQAAVRPT